MLTLTGNALTVLQQRYLLRDSYGRIAETPEELFRRVALAVAEGTSCKNTKEHLFWAEKYYALMANQEFLPNSPTLMNAGTSSNQLSACFVLPVEDTMNGIFNTLRQSALIQQSGGGTGFNFSHLRPKDDMVSNSGGTASGPLSFMKIFDAATEHIRQGGKRRGANMGILNIDHPDIESFIESKKEKSTLRNFNISVGMTDVFMQTLHKNESWNLIHPNSGKIVQTGAADALWKKIVEAAWQTGDPGLVFLDTINRHNPTPAIGKIESTNPCGEVPLLPYEPCNLGSVNLSKFIHSGNRSPDMNWESLADVVQTAIRFLDDVIEVNQYFIPEVKQMALANRKIGLGVMGWADALIGLGIPYASDRAVELANKVMSFIAQSALTASSALARERGVFPNWEKSIYYPHTPVRNATQTSIAPTGTISIIAGTSSSIEPLYALAFQRKHVLNDTTLQSFHQPFVQYLREHNLYDEAILNQVMHDSVASGLERLSPDAKKLFQTALEIPAIWHLRHQLAFQAHTGNAVSKTINLPTEATVDQVAFIYETAWKMGAKGITIFRDRSAGSQVLHRGIRPDTAACKVCME